MERLTAQLPTPPSLADAANFLADGDSLSGEVSLNVFSWINALHHLLRQDGVAACERLSAKCVESGHAPKALRSTVPDRCALSATLVHLQSRLWGGPTWASRACSTRLWAR